MLRTAPARAVVGLTLGAVVYSVVFAVRAFDQIIEACSLPRRVGR